ncbi:MAG: hypothetical protein M3N57_05710 [Actinomycetota bacterium]|nr:hypothetical protein [Actinomycetota bacterium]
MTIGRLLGVVAGVSGSLVVASTGLLGAAHLDDRFRVDHVGGARLALAWYLNHGVLYPPLVDGQFYGGTRFMPLPIVLGAGVARLTGEYLVSGKVVAYVVGLALLAVLFSNVRRRSGSVPVALLLVAMVPATATGLSALLGLRADALPLLLQLVALETAVRWRRPARDVAAAVLGVLAVAAKLSAVWAPLALIAWFLLRREIRRLIVFLTVSVALIAALVGVLVVVTDGRFSDNVFGLATAGITGPADVLRAPYILVRLLTEHATALWALFPAVLVAGWLALRERDPDPYLLAFGSALVVVIVVLTDRGTGPNQLVDLVTLGAVVLGGLVGRRWRPRQLNEPVKAVLGVALTWVVLSGFAVAHVPELQRLGGWATTRPLDGLPAVSGPILSEDPYVPVAHGQRPIVLDPFMLRRIYQRDPALVRPLVQRIERGDFQYVVLVEPLEPLDREWWNDMHLGPELVRAIASAYQPLGRHQGYHVYVPSGVQPPR